MFPQDAKNRLFDLNMKLSELKQGSEESIADYLSRVDNVFSKFPSEGFDIGMAAVKGIQDQTHQGWIEKECRKESNFDFTFVKRMAEVAYRKIGKPDPFDPSAHLNGTSGFGALACKYRMSSYNNS